MRSARANAFVQVNRAQRSLLRNVVKGRWVSEFGAGDLELANMMAGMGAKQVFALDRSYYPYNIDRLIPVIRPRVEIHTPPQSFSELLADVQEPESRPMQNDRVAVVAWPDAGTSDRDEYEMEALARLLNQFEYVVYIGKNTDGCVCGHLVLFEYLVTREVVAHAPDRYNTMIVYGHRDRSYPYILPEEAAALTTWSRSRRGGRIVSYEDSFRIAKVASRGYEPGVVYAPEPPDWRPDEFIPEDYYTSNRSRGGRRRR